MTASANDLSARLTSTERDVNTLGAPSRRLLQAAVSGLLAAGVSGCPNDDKPQNTKSELSDAELSSLCADMVNKAVDAQKVDAAVSSDAGSPDLDLLCADKVKDAQATACVPKTTEEKTTSSDQIEYTFSDLTTMCDSRGGYVQIQAACGSENVCSGFSYADWGPGAATLTEHTCAGVNACNGLSCVVLPKDSDKSGPDIYAEKFDDPGPGACSNCHAVTKDDGKPDLTTFQLWLHPGATRTTDNWLDRPVAEQERVVAFGVHGIEPGGPATQTMAPYFKVLSRKEIERVVAHVRTLAVVVKPIKLADK